MPLHAAACAGLPHAWWNRPRRAVRRPRPAPAESLPETLYVFSPQGQLFRFRSAAASSITPTTYTDLADQCEAFTSMTSWSNRTSSRPGGAAATPASGPTQVWLNAHTGAPALGIERFLRRGATRRRPGAAAAGQAAQGDGRPLRLQCAGAPHHRSHRPGRRLKLADQRICWQTSRPSASSPTRSSTRSLPTRSCAKCGCLRGRAPRSRCRCRNAAGVRR